MTDSAMIKHLVLLLLASNLLRFSAQMIRVFSEPAKAALPYARPL